MCLYIRYVTKISIIIRSGCCMKANKSLIATTFSGMFQFLVWQLLCLERLSQTTTDTLTYYNFSELISKLWYTIWTFWYLSLISELWHLILDRFYLFPVEEDSTSPKAVRSWFMFNTKTRQVNLWTLKISSKKIWKVLIKMDLIGKNA